jgi:MSHA biogenesis protein MshP
MTPPPTRPRQQPRSLPARGLGAVAVVMVLVVMATLAAAVLRLGRQAHTTVSQDILGLRAGAAARAGIEYGLYQALKGTWTTCSNASTTLDLGTDLGMRVTVSCHSVLYNEGESAPGVPQTVRTYTVDAVACNGSSSCPDVSAAARETYVERRRQAQAVN